MATKEITDTWQIIPDTNTVKLWNGGDQCFLITPSGFSEESRRYIVVDIGPYDDAGSTQYMSNGDLKRVFGLIVEQPEFDKI